MKKITSIFHASIVAAVATIAIASFSSCQEMSSMTIEAAVESYNEECPIDMGDGLIMDRVYTSGNNVVFSYKTEDYNVILGLKILGNEAKELVMDELRQVHSNDKGTQLLVDLCIEAKYNIVYKYSDYAGNSESVTFSYHDLAQL